MSDRRTGFSVRTIVSGGLKSTMVTNTIWLGSSSAVSGMMSAISSALLARTLGVAEFGVLTLVIAMVNLIVDLTDLGATSTFVRFGSQSVASGESVRFREILSVILRFKFAVGSVIFLLALLFVRPIVGHVFRHVDGRIVSYFLIALVPALLGVVASIYYPIFQSFKDFRTHSLLSILRAIVKLGSIVALLLLSGTITVSRGIWIEAFSVLLFLLLNIYYSPVNAFGFARPEKALSRQILSFNKWLMLYQLITIASTRLDIFFVGGLADSSNLGLYSVASKIVGLVIAVTNSYYAVLIADISSHRTHEDIRRKARKAVFTAAIIIMGFPLLALLAKPLTVLVFGESYAAAATILQIMCVGVALQVLVYPLNALLYAYNRTEVFPLMSVASAVGIIGGNLYLIPRYGSIGAAIAFSLSALLSLLVAVVYYRWKRDTLEMLSPDDKQIPLIQQEA